MKRDDSSPPAYIDSIDGELKPLLLAVRGLIFEVEPEIDEHIEYGMLAFGDLANLAAQKNYVSLYVAPAALAKLKAKYPDINCGKSCLRFASMQHFNEQIIREVLLLAQGLPPEQRSC
tara:strand:+ start:4405 stop:4758 length:354 start_codon:yes stop_codon:yes gene_type:complete